jgi:hypothetical protein
MAVGVTLVYQGHNHLRYALDIVVPTPEPPLPPGGPFTIPNDGGASPDLLTDSLAGPLKTIARARLDGIGVVPPGPLTQAQARAILLADGSAANVGNAKVRRAIVQLVSRDDAGGTQELRADADVDAQGDPIITGRMSAGAAYLDVVFVDAIGA